MCESHVVSLESEDFKVLLQTNGMDVNPTHETVFVELPTSVRQAREPVSSRVDPCMPAVGWWRVDSRGR